jgi:uncharacterized ubiquitin-like protein YukD
VVLGQINVQMKEGTKIMVIDFCMVVQTNVKVVIFFLLSVVKINIHVKEGTKIMLIDFGKMLKGS